MSAQPQDGGPQWEQQIAHYCSMDLPDKARQAYTHMVEAGRPCDTPTYNCLIATFAHRRRADRAQQFFDAMVRSPHAQPDEESYNLLLQAYGEARQPAEAQRLLAHMHQHALQPSIDSYNALLGAYVALGDLEGAERLWAHMEAQRTQEGLVANERTYQAMLDLAAARHDSERALQWLQRMHAHGPVSDEAVATVMELLGGQGEYERARALFHQLQEGRTEAPSCGMYTALIQAALACEQFDEAWAQYEAMKKAGVDPSARTLDLLIHYCGHSHRLHEAACLLNELDARHLTPTLRVERVKRLLHNIHTV